jgi:hypothetical protein
MKEFACGRFYFVFALFCAALRRVALAVSQQFSMFSNIAGSGHASCRFSVVLGSSRGRAATCNLNCTLQHRTQQRCHRNMQHAHHSAGARSKQQLRGHFYKQLQSGAIVYICSCSCRHGGSKDNASHRTRGSVSYIKLHRVALRPQGAAYCIADALLPVHEGCR